MERITAPFMEGDDLEINVRPNRLKDFVGQKKIKDNLDIFIQASKQRNENLDHILFYGPPGLGKTTLSQIVASEMESSIKYISGPAISKQGDLAAIITNLAPKDILFIDEIHRIPISVEEMLYIAMEDYKIDFIVGEGPTARSIRIDLPRFTLVGATTRFGMLSSPLRDRFGIVLQLDFYDLDELTLVVLRSCKILGLAIEKPAAVEIAKRSRGTPRIANRLLRRLRDFLTISAKNTLDVALVNKGLWQLGVDSYGLDDLDRKYLQSIVKYYNGGPVGIDTIATILSESKDTIEETIEPYLIKNGLIVKTPRGRALAKEGWDYIKEKQLN